MAPAGTVLTPIAIGALAAFGIRRIRVRPVLRVGILTTEDEVVEPGQAASAPQVYNASAALLRAQLEHLACRSRRCGTWSATTTSCAVCWGPPRSATRTCGSLRAASPRAPSRSSAPAGTASARTGSGGYGSHLLASAALADALIVLEPGEGALPAGASVEIRLL